MQNLVENQNSCFFFPTPFDASRDIRSLCLSAPTGFVNHPSTSPTFAEMSLSLASKPVSAAACPALSVNLLNRKRATSHNVPNTTSHVELPVTVSFLNQEATTCMEFVVFDGDVGFEVVFGIQWESWTTLRTIKAPDFVEHVPNTSPPYHHL